MENLLLAKPNLPENFIDLSVGEAHVVKEIFLKHFDLTSKFPKSFSFLEYPEPNGYDKLVSLLEEKHGFPVIITNGAKQALAASFYAIQKLNKNNVGMLSPYWALIPPLMEMHGLNPVIGQHPYNSDAYLALAPNNPDGHFIDLQCLETTCKSKAIPLIHDGAYFTHTYVPDYIQTDKVYGDVQIFSISKSFGLSGLRLGYAVCQNPAFYAYMQEYMEMMTVGVSMASQHILYDLLSKIEAQPDKLIEFEDESSAALWYARKKLSEVNPEILQFNSDYLMQMGMFAWCKVGVKADFTKVKLNVIDGKFFGKENMVRLNLAFNEKQINEIVNRLNNI